MINPNKTKSINIITKALATKGVFQFRCYVTRNKNGTKEQHGENLKKALFRLNDDGALNITSRRLFTKSFNDGSSISGVNYIAMPTINQVIK
jgi:hypothetical protein